MLAKLIALLKGTRPESTEFDYTRQHWGQALHFVRGFKPKGKMEITGHFFGAGLSRRCYAQQTEAAAPAPTA